MTAQFINEVCTTIQNMGFDYKVRFFDDNGMPFASPVLDGYLCGKRHTITPEKAAEILGSDDFDSLESAWYRILRFYLDHLGCRTVGVKIEKREA